MGSGKEYGVSHLNSYVNDKIRKESQIYIGALAVEDSSYLINGLRTNVVYVPDVTYLCIIFIGILNYISSIPWNYFSRQFRILDLWFKTVKLSLLELKHFVSDVINACIYRKPQLETK